VRKVEWVVYAKTVCGPQAVLAYLSRYLTRRDLQSPLISADNTASRLNGRITGSKGRASKTMTLRTGEFIRRFSDARAAKGLHRIRHYGLFANASRANIARARELLAVPSRPKRPRHPRPQRRRTPRAVVSVRPLRRLHIIIETFAGGCQPKHRPARHSGG